MYMLLRLRFFLTTKVFMVILTFCPFDAGMINCKIKGSQPLFTIGETLKERLMGN